MATEPPGNHFQQGNKAESAATATPPSNRVQDTTTAPPETNNQQENQTESATLQHNNFNRSNTFADAPPGVPDTEALAALHAAAAHTATWQLPLSAAEREPGTWPSSHSQWALDAAATGVCASDAHLDDVLGAPTVCVVQAGPSAGLPTVAAALAGWRVRRSWLHAEACDCRPHRAVLRRLAVRLPQQVDALALARASDVAFPTSAAACAAMVRPGEAVWVACSAQPAAAWAQEVAAAAAVAGNQVFFSGFTDADAAWPDGVRRLIVPTDPWGAWASTPPPEFPAPSTTHEDILAAPALAEHARGFHAAWAPMGLTALDGVQDSPDASRARVAGLWCDEPLWVLTRIAADGFVARTAAHHRTPVARCADLVHASGVHWLPATPNDTNDDTAAATEHGLLGQLEAHTRMPQYRPPALPSLRPLHAIFPEVHLAPGQRHDPNEYDLHQRFKTKYTQGAWSATVETHRDADGLFVHEDCEEGFSAVEPVELMFPRLVGKVFYGNPQFDRIAEYFDVIRRAIARDPTTRGTVILPERPWEPWWRTHVCNPRRYVEVVDTFEARPSAGAAPVLFDYKDDRGRRRRADPIRENIVVARVGHPTVLAELRGDAARENPPETLPATIGADMLAALTARAANLSLEEAEAANPPEAIREWHSAFVASPDDIHAATEQEHADCVSDLEYAEARHEVLGVLEPAIRRLWGGSGVRRARRWLRNDVDGVPEPEQWFCHGTPDHRTHLRPERMFLWTLLAPTLLGADGLEAALDTRFGCQLHARTRKQGRRPSFAPSVHAFLDRLRGEIDFYKRAGIAVPPPDGVARLVHDALAVRREPDDGKARLCIWFRDLNEATVVVPFSMPTPEECFAHSRPEFLVFKRDLAKAFLQLTMQRDDIADMGFVDPTTGEVLCLTVPMFGLSEAPRCLHIAVQAMLKAHATCLRTLALLLAPSDPGRADQLRDVADSLYAYADDHFWTGTRFACAAVHLVLTLEGAALGETFDPRKDVFGRIITVLGKELNIPGQFIRISPMRAHLYAASIRAFLLLSEYTPNVPRRTFERLRGRLQFTADCSRWLAAWCVPLNQALYPADGSTPTHITITDTLRELLSQNWLPLLEEAESPWLRKSRWACLPLARALEWTHELIPTDASTSFGEGAVWRGQVLQRMDASHRHINVKELEATTSTFAYAAARTTEPTRFVLPTDNATNSHRVRTGAARDEYEANLLNSLASIAVAGGHDVLAPWVPGKHIIDVGADAASREADTSAFTLPAGAEIQRAIARVLSSQLPGTTSFAAALRAALDFERVALFWERVPAETATVPEPLRADQAGRAWSNRCAACATRCTRNTGVWCRACGFTLHRSCSGVEQLLEAQHTWTCPACLRDEYISGGDEFAARMPAGSLAATAALIARSTEASTATTQGCDVRRFIRVMEAHGVDTTDLLPQPGSAHPTPASAVSSFIGFAATPDATGKFPFAPSTIANTVTALRSMHRQRGIAHGFAASDARIKQALAGARRAQRHLQSGHAAAAVAVPVEHLKIVLATVWCRRNQMLVKGDIRGAYACSRDALWMALAFVACLRKSEVTRLTVADVEPHPTVPGGLLVHVRYAKNNQEGDTTYTTVAIARVTADGIDIGELLDVHRALLDLRGCSDPTTPLFGDMDDPSRQLSEKGQAIMQRLHKNTPHHEAYYETIERHAPDVPRVLRTKAHAFRRGGITHYRKYCIKAGYTGDGLITFLRAFGRWKSVDSLMKYLAVDAEEMVGIVAGDSRFFRLAAAPEPSDTQREAAQLAIITDALEHTTLTATRAPPPTPPTATLALPPPPPPQIAAAAGNAPDSATVTVAPVPPPPPLDTDLAVRHIPYRRNSANGWQFLVEWDTPTFLATWQPRSDLPHVALREVPALPAGLDGILCTECDLPHDPHPAYGTFLLCDSCSRRGGHLSCMGLTSVPPGAWLCTHCTTPRAVRRP